MLNISIPHISNLHKTNVGIHQVQIFLEKQPESCREPESEKMLSEDPATENSLKAKENREGPGINPASSK